MGTRNRYLPSYNIVPQPTTLPNIPGEKGRPAHKADNFTAISEPIV
jgi:hypothetical protein